MGRLASDCMATCRHADSEQDQPGVRDHDRSISSAGTHDARAVAQHLRDEAWLPDLLLCSNSKRTRQTVDAMAEEVPAFGDADSHFLGTLYTIAALDGMTKSHLSMRVRRPSFAGQHGLLFVMKTDVKFSLCFLQRDIMFEEECQCLIS